MDGGAWQATVHGVTKSWTRLSDFTFTFHFPTLEKEMATHSSVLGWRIPGTGEPGGCRLWGHTELDTTEVTQQQQYKGSPSGSVVKNLPAMQEAQEDPGSIPELGRSPERGNGNLFQYHMDRGAWQATVHSVSESDTTEH